MGRMGADAREPRGACANLGLSDLFEGVELSR